MSFDSVMVIVVLASSNMGDQEWELGPREGIEGARVWLHTAKRGVCSRRNGLMAFFLLPSFPRRPNPACLFADFSLLVLSTVSKWEGRRSEKKIEIEKGKKKTTDKGKRRAQWKVSRLYSQSYFSYTLSPSWGLLGAKWLFSQLRSLRNS